MQGSEHVGRIGVSICVYSLLDIYSESDLQRRSFLVVVANHFSSIYSLICVDWIDDAGINIFCIICIYCILLFCIYCILYFVYNI